MGELPSCRKFSASTTGGTLNHFCFFTFVSGVFRFTILFFRAFPAFPKLFSMLVAFAVSVFRRFVIEMSSHAPAIAVPHIFVSFLHVRGRIIFNLTLWVTVARTEHMSRPSALDTHTLLSLVCSPHVLNLDLSNSLLQTLGVSVEKQTKARAATAAKEPCIGLLDRLRQTRFDRHCLRHPHHLSPNHLPRGEIYWLDGFCRQPPLLPSEEDAAKMPLSNASNILFFEPRLVDVSSP